MRISRLHEQKEQDKATIQQNKATIQQLIEAVTMLTQENHRLRQLVELAPAHGLAANGAAIMQGVQQAPAPNTSTGTTALRPLMGVATDR